MVQTFTVNRREMTLEQAQEYYAAQKAAQAPVSVEEVKVDTIQEKNIKEPEKSTEELKKECDKLGIKYHPASRVPKLTELLQNFKKGV